MSLTMLGQLYIKGSSKTEKTWTIRSCKVAGFLTIPFTVLSVLIHINYNILNY